MLQERYNKSMTLEEAGTLVVRVLQETMEEKVRRPSVTWPRAGEVYRVAALRAPDCRLSRREPSAPPRPRPTHPPTCSTCFLLPLPASALPRCTQVTSTNIELARVVPGAGYRLVPKAEVETLMAKAAADAAAEGTR